MIDTLTMLISWLGFEDAMNLYGISSFCLGIILTIIILLCIILLTGFRKSNSENNTKVFKAVFGSNKTKDDK